MSTNNQLSSIASQVRRDVLRMVSAAGSGHPGGSLSSADIMTALFFKVMHHDPKTWSRSAKGQDAFILSAGHLAPVYYSVLARCGYFDLKELGSLRKCGAMLQGHPSLSTFGVYQPSGSLGQGLSAAAGIALAKKMDGEKEKVYVLCGDGELEEGQNWEAAMFAASKKLGNLIAMTDCNNRQIDGDVSKVGGVEDYGKIWESFGWDVIRADGHDFTAILEAFGKADDDESGRPKMIVFSTEMGHGVDFMAGQGKWHGKTPSQEELAVALGQLEETLGDY